MNAQPEGRDELPGGGVLVVEPPPVPPPGPIAQSVAIGFRTVYIAAALLLLVWLTSNIREISSGSQAVVSRFGRIVRSQEAGLLVAWPRPIERVQLLPGPQRQLSEDIAALQAPTEKAAELIGPGTSANSAVPSNAEAYLTGDGNAVLLTATLIYRISDPIAYALQRQHVAPALDRLFRSSTVQVAAGHNLNDFLVVPNADQVSQGNNTVALRTEVRSTLLQAVNARLQRLAADGASLGVTIDRIDITPLLPPEAKSAFDAVLVAAQAADRNVATANTAAERRRQSANQLAAQLVSSAQATAKETVSNATVATATILPLEREETPLTRSSLLLNVYRTDVGNIMNRVGSVTLVDPKSGARFLMPGSSPASGAGASSSTSSAGPPPAAAAAMTSTPSSP